MIWQNCFLALVAAGWIWIAAVGVQDTAKERAAWRERAIKMTAEHWKERVRGFEKENEALKGRASAQGGVVLLGDSLTEAFDVGKHFPGRRLLNRGIGSDAIGLPNDPLGEGVRGVMQRLKVSVFDGCTSHVFVMVGINDLGDGRKPEEMLVGYRRLLEELRRGAPGATIHVESVLPTGGRYARHNENVRKFNVMLRQLARAMKCEYVDLHRLYADEKGELRAEFTRDGLHLAPEAYEAWKKEIDRAMGWK